MVRTPKKRVVYQNALGARWSYDVLFRLRSTVNRNKQAHEDLTHVRMSKCLWTEGTSDIYRRQTILSRAQTIFEVDWSFGKFDQIQMLNESILTKSIRIQLFIIIYYSSK